MSRESDRATVERDERIVRAIQQFPDKKYREIGEMFGVSLATVCAIARRYGIARGSGYHKVEIDFEDVERRRRSGEGLRTIARDYGLTDEGLRYRLIANGSYTLPASTMADRRAWNKLRARFGDRFNARGVEKED